MRAARAGDAAGKRVEQRLRRRALPPGARNSPHELTRVNTRDVASKVHNAFILGNNWQHFEKDAFSQRRMRVTLWRARSRLYRSRCLRVNIRFAAFGKLYKICAPLHRSELKIFRFSRKSVIFAEF